MNISRAYILYILFTLIAFCHVAPSWAQKQSKQKKEKQTFIITEITPDPVARKSRPDRHPAEVPVPQLGQNSKGNVDTYTHGIDVSHYQGRINWDEVAKEPKVGYVYLKATEGTNITDDTYQRNFNECKRVGLKVGSYLFFRPHLSPRAQFNLFVSTVDTKKQDLLPLVDAEVIKGVSVSVFQARLLELCELLEREYGKKPVIYTGRNFFNKYICNNSRLLAYKFFIAAYAFDEPDLSGGHDYVMWQYSATERVRGIRGDVDMSRFVGRHTLQEIMY